MLLDPNDGLHYPSAVLRIYIYALRRFAYLPICSFADFFFADSLLCSFLLCYNPSGTIGGTWMIKKKPAPSKNGFEYELPKKVAILYSDAQREYFLTEAQYITEKDADHDAELIGSYLETLGIEVLLYSGSAELPWHLRRDRPEMVINLVDSIRGSDGLASAIPGVLELLDLPYTGADILGLSLDSNKFVIKKQLQQNDVPPLAT